MTSSSGKKIAIIKTGSVAEPVAAVHGDFEDWFTAGLGLSPDQVIVVNAHLGDPLPAPGSFDALLITGSSAMVTDRAPWSEGIARWLRDLFPTEMPVLGVCYGHQIIADALGGEVGNNPNGREIGTVEINLLEAARRDPLLGALPDAVISQASHSQSVLKPAPGFQVMASNELDAYQACFRAPACWTVQFHPEFDGAVMAAFITLRAAPLRAEGFDVDDLLAKVGDGPDAGGILRRFAALVFGD